MRPTSYQSQRFIVTPMNNYTGTFDQEQRVEHSPLIGGYFSVNIGGIKVNNGIINYATS